MIASREIRLKRTELIERAEAITASVASERRSMSTEERSSVVALLNEARAMDSEIRSAEEKEDRERNAPIRGRASTL